MRELLEDLITRIVQNLEEEKMDKRIEHYHDYKSKYVNLRPRVVVKVELTDGKVCEIDVTDYFEGVVK